MERTKIKPETKQDILCPCCYNNTIANLGEYEICSICRWEDDPYQFENPDFAGGANRMSLNQARNAYINNIKVE